MTREQAVSSFLVGDPVSLPATITSAGDLLAALEIVPAGHPGVLPVTPGVAIVHTLTVAGGTPTIRWARLPHAPSLASGTGPVTDALALAIPMTGGGDTLRTVSRLKGLLSDPVVRANAHAAVTREALVRALAPTGASTAEIPLTAAEALALLDSRSDGLSDSEVVRRRAMAGENRIERTRRRSATLRLLEQFWSMFAILLWVGGALAFVAGMPQLGLAIFVVILVNGVFGFLQEYRAERAIEALARLLPPTIAVKRNGREARIPSVELVPGDVVRVEEGDQVPADGQLLATAGLEVDQGSLTGESWSVFKVARPVSARGVVPLEERHEMVFAGTAIVAGAGTFVVSATGMATEIGGIARLTQGVVEEPSPLQREMARVTRVVTLLAITLGGLFLLVSATTGALPLDQGFLFAIGVIVANVPEGLLPTLTLALAMGAQRLARRRCLMRRLSSVETLGSTTVICTDKTGTLTENRMAARFVWVAGETRDATELGPETGPGTRELFVAAALASRATPEHGDPTEVAMVRAGAAAGVDCETVRRAHPLVRPFPFDSFRKRMTHVCASGDGVAAYVKGAPQETLALCETVRLEGRTMEFAPAMRRDLLAEHDRLAAQGLRILAVASRPLPGTLGDASTAEVERQLTLLGMAAFWDPPRPEVPDAIGLCQRAGIRVVMVTGDHGLTARAIAARIGLPVRTVVTGAELDTLGRDALRDLVAESGLLFARVSPTHKLLIVQALKERGEVVAVTGDGVNDAPALKAADIGVAMGLRGSDVAREAATMVIADDNFASIVSAVRGGRAIYANMGKFVTYIFASNIPELVPFLVFVLLGIPLPLTVMQILAVDLGTDLLPALALGAEPPEPDVMDRPPRPRGRRLLGAGRLLRAYAFLGVAEAALAMFAFFWTYWLAGWRPGLPMAAEGDLYHRATTMTLAGIVAAQVGNVFACRTDRESVFRVGIFSNRLVILGVVAEVGLLLTLIAAPPLARAFGLSCPSFAEWRLLLLFPPVMVLLEEVRKWLARRGRADRAATSGAPRTARLDVARSAPLMTSVGGR
jgi:Ca2+-transporting ATPase